MSKSKEDLQNELRQLCQSPKPSITPNTSPQSLSCKKDDDEVETIKIEDPVTITWKFSANKSKNIKVFIPKIDIDLIPNKDSNERDNLKERQFDAILRDCNAPVGFTHNELNPYRSKNNQSK